MTACQPLPPADPPPAAHPEKTRYDLVLDGLPTALRGLADAMRSGAEKYGDHDWRGISDWESIYRRKVYRHMMEFASGEKADKDSGMHPLYHMVADAMIYLERMETQ